MTSRSHFPATLEREPDWTHRQREVLDLLGKGWTNVQIAEHFGISLDGAKWHVREIMAKLDVASREDVAAYWRARNSTGARLRRAFAGLAILGRAGTVARIVAGVSVVAAGAAVFAGVLRKQPKHQQRRQRHHYHPLCHRHSHDSRSHARTNSDVYSGRNSTNGEQ
jgi:DNA-binding CsgD family transcriptional regulator